VKRILTSSFAALALVSCQGDPFESGPDEDLLQARFATELPAFVKLNSLNVQASENVGTEVQPIYRSRFSAVIELIADTYLENSRQGSAVFVVPHLNSGDDVPPS
jgi:hypothetical protein